MSFENILQSIVGESQGAIGAVLMGSDGIAIEQVQARPAPLDMDADEVGAAGIEFGRVLDDIRKVSDSLGGGAVLETLVRLARFTLVFQPIEDDVFLVLAITPDGNLGKARYLMRRHLLALRTEI